MIRTREVTVTYLEMLSPADLRPSQRRVIDFNVVQVTEPAPEFARFLYTAIGSEWYWIDRLPWALAEWQAHVARPEVETWVGYVNGTPCGYFELECEPGPEVQVTYFGLLASYIGRGLGGQLLTAAVQRAWALSPDACGCTPVRSTVRLRWPTTRPAASRCINERLPTASSTRRRPSPGRGQCGTAGQHDTTACNPRERTGRS